MSFDLAAHAAGVSNVDLFNAFLPSPQVAARGQFPKAIMARNDSSVPTVRMFVDGVSPNMEYEASIIDVCPDATTFALRCTSGPSTLTAGVCGSNAVVVTVTSGPATYRISQSTATRTLGYDVSATVQETCDLAGTTRAVCTATLGGSVDRTTTSASTTTTYTGTRMWHYDVAITAGAEKTASPKSTCGAGGSSAGSTKSVAVWGLVGVVGLVSTLML